MRVALTGGTGLVGKYLLPALRARGHEVRLLVRPLPDRELPPLDGVEVVEGRLDELAPIQELVRGCDVILHAGFLHPEEPPLRDRSVPEHWSLTNYMGSIRLLERVVEVREQQMIYVSSLAVYGADPNLDPLGERYVRDEEYPLWPDQYYGALRAAVEKLVIAAHKVYGLNTSVFRLGHVFGVRTGGGDTPTACAVDEAIEHGEIRTPHGSYGICVEDAAEILADAVGNEEIAGRVFNTFDRWIEYAELAPLLSELLGREIRATCPPAPPPKQPILGDRIHAHWPRFRTEECLRGLVETLVRQRTGG